MTVSQNVSVGLLALGLAYWYRLSRWPAVRYADRATEVVAPDRAAAAVG
jgi:hypothetical protein